LSLLCVLGVWSLVSLQSRARQVEVIHAELAQIDVRVRAMQRDSAVVQTGQQDPVADLRHILQVDDAGRDAMEGAQTIAGIMKRHQLSWTSTDYKASRDAATGLRRVEMQIVVKAPYPLVRSLAEDILRALPRASLDGLVTRRDEVDQAVPTTTMTLSIWSMGS
jgi:hypothetical protein